MMELKSYAIGVGARRGWCFKSVLDWPTTLGVYRHAVGHF